jgi:hypothetical protein
MEEAGDCLFASAGSEFNLKISIVYFCFEKVTEIVTCKVPGHDEETGKLTAEARVAP